MKNKFRCCCDLRTSNRMQPGSFLVADPEVLRRFKKSVMQSGSMVIQIMRPTGLCLTLALSLLSVAKKLQCFFLEPDRAPNGRNSEVDELTTANRQRIESLEAESIMIYHSCWSKLLFDRSTDEFAANLTASIMEFSHSILRSVIGIAKFF